MMSWAVTSLEQEAVAPRAITPCLTGPQGLCSLVMGAGWLPGRRGSCLHIRCQQCVWFPRRHSAERAHLGCTMRCCCLGVGPLPQSREYLAQHMPQQWVG